MLRINPDLRYNNLYSAYSAFLIYAEKALTARTKQFACRPILLTQLASFLNQKDTKIANLLISGLPISGGDLILLKMVNTLTVLHNLLYIVQHFN